MNVKLIIAALVAGSALVVAPYADAGQRYHRPGHKVQSVPKSSVVVNVGRSKYHYHNGVYYRARGNSYVVVAAPLGARVRSLPVGFVSFGIGVNRYFFVNSTYYLWHDDTKEYVVVEKPAGADEALTESSSGEIFVYPANGQTAEQTDRDRYECHRWAADESGFDPTKPNQSPALKTDYDRAISACLVGRGYTVG